MKYSIFESIILINDKLNDWNNYFYLIKKNEKSKVRKEEFRVIFNYLKISEFILNIIFVSIVKYYDYFNNFIY